MSRVPISSILLTPTSAFNSLTLTQLINIMKSIPKDFGNYQKRQDVGTDNAVIGQLMEVEIDPI